MCLQTLCLVLFALNDWGVGLDVSLRFGIVLVLFSSLLLKSASRIRIAGVWKRRDRGKLKRDGCHFFLSFWPVLIF